MAEIVYSHFIFQVVCILFLVINHCSVLGCLQSQNNETSVVECSPPYKECCIQDQISCCTAPSRRFFQINKMLAIAIAVSVSSVSVLLTILVVVCCFWSRCPLYSACRVRYTHDSTSCVEKGGELNQMPAESGAKGPKRLVLTKNCTNGTPGPPYAVADV